MKWNSDKGKEGDTTVGGHGHRWMVEKCVWFYGKCVENTAVERMVMEVRYRWYDKWLANV